MKIRTLQDKVEMVEHRNVRLRVTTDSGSETLLCPSDFYDLIENLRRADGLVERIVLHDDKFAGQLTRLGLIVRNSRGSYGGTALLRKHAGKLTKVWESRTMKWCEE